jgi:peroxiredoxin Q/BCP
MDFILEHGWMIIFVIWGLPLTYYRSRFRKMVYETDHWLINIQPKFIKEVKALFGYHKVDDNNFVKQRNFYRFYLLIYLILFVCYLYFN